MKKLYGILSLLFFLNTVTLFPQVSVDSMDITTSFYGPFNKTTVKFYLHNHSERDSIGGTIDFDANKTSFIENMYLEIDGKLKKAHTLQAGQGTTIYNTITRRRIDPALLLKTGEGKYSLSVFPFRKHQTRIVVIDYYSIVESSSIVLPEWYFKIVNAYNIKSRISFSSLQEANADVYQINGNNSELIIAVRTINQLSSIEKQIINNSSLLKFQFDFKKIKNVPRYFSGSISYYHLNSIQKDSTFFKPQTTLTVTPAENYPPDFLMELRIYISSQDETLNICASGRDSFLNDFLKYLDKQGKIHLSLRENISNKIHDCIRDNYNWFKSENKWNYFDKEFSLVRNKPGRKFKYIEINCPFLNKFVEYTASFDSSINAQVKCGFLNSNLSKLVIEDDERAIQIWENVTKTKYGDEPTYFVAVEEMPEPIGGIAAIQNSVYFPASLKPYCNFKIYILAFINKTGHVTYMKLINPKSVINIDSYNVTDFNNEIVSLIEKVSEFGISIPDWKPGKQRNEPVPVQVSIPLTFKVDSIDTANKVTEYVFGEREFIPLSLSDYKCYLFENGFKEHKSVKVNYKSDKFYELMIQHPELIEVMYKAIYLSSWDGVGFIVNVSGKKKYYLIKN